MTAQTAEGESYTAGHLTNADEKGKETRSDNTVMLHGRENFYRQFVRKIWTPMWQRRPYDKDEEERKFDVFDGGGGERPDYSVEASPIPGDKDPIDRALEEIKNPKKCEVRIIQRSWVSGTRKDVARELYDLGEKGCTLHVITSREAGALGDNDFAKDQLCKSGAPLKELFEVPGVHDKVLMAEWNDAGDHNEHRSMVLTGSHNLSPAARNENDELLVTIRDNQTAYDAFRSHWQRARNSNPQKDVQRVKCR